jgi:hypothetical protein
LGLIPIGFGVSFVALGAVGIHYGKQRHTVRRAWRDADPHQVALIRAGSNEIALWRA